MMENIYTPATVEEFRNATLESYDTFKERLVDGYTQFGYDLESEVVLEGLKIAVDGIKDCHRGFSNILNGKYKKCRFQDLYEDTIISLRKDYGFNDNDLHKMQKFYAAYYFYMKKALKEFAAAA